MSVTCTCKYGHDSSRSVVRQIGVRIPLDTGRRVHIQVPWYSEGNADTASQPDAGLTLTSYLSYEGEEGRGWEAGDVGSDDSGMEATLDGEEEDTGTEQKQEAMEKISALESELARLKAQIAVYALSEESNIPPAPPAPPPPPVAPPLPPSFSTPAPPSRVPLLSRDARGNAPATPAHPNFSHVLQDLGSVKLRSVPSIVRSPGGTPMRRKDRVNCEPASNDPAAIIAQALRRKFANRMFQDSPDKENLDRSSDTSTSGFDSPAGKLFS
jgi:hypothetical protein